MQYVEIGQTVTFWFAANDIDGSASDGTTPVARVRKAGDAENAAPVGSIIIPKLLTHADYPDGLHEVSVQVLSASGFVVNATYGVFSTVAVDGENPAGFIGAFQTASVKAAISASGLAAASYHPDTNMYWAKCEIQDDNANSLDRYLVTWYQNSQPLFTGMSDAKIQVVDAADGSDLIAETALAAVAATGDWKLEQGPTGRVEDGKIYVIVLTVTIGGLVYKWKVQRGRDS